MRPVVARTTALPYLATWTAAGVDVNAIVANSPVEIPALQMHDADMLVIYPATDTGAFAPQWQLTLTDRTILGSAGVEGVVIASLAAISSNAPTTRRSDAVGSSGYDIHNPMHFDLRGLHGGDQRTWALGIAALGGATNVYLLEYTVIKRRPL